LRALIETYFAPNQTIRHLGEVLQSGSGIDLLKTSARRRRIRALGQRFTENVPGAFGMRSARRWQNSSRQAGRLGKWGWAMNMALWLIGLIGLTLSYARAESVSATCSFEVNGRTIWDGGAASSSPQSTTKRGSLVEVSPKRFGICVYKDKYPEQDDLPTS